VNLTDLAEKWSRLLPEYIIPSKKGTAYPLCVRESPGLKAIFE
jgi:hypothetical protein